MGKRDKTLRSGTRNQKQNISLWETRGARNEKQKTLHHGECKGHEEKHKGCHCEERKRCGNLVFGFGRMTRDPGLFFHHGAHGEARGKIQRPEYLIHEGYERPSRKNCRIDFGHETQDFSLPRGTRGSTGKIQRPETRNREQDICHRGVADPRRRDHGGRNVGAR